MSQGPAVDGPSGQSRDPAGLAGARIDYRALAQWAETGAVRPRARSGSRQRRYRLGRWHSRSTSSWNPPAAGAAVEKLAGAGSQSIVSVDISRKPSESRRSSAVSVHTPPPTSRRSIVSDDEFGEECGPLAQLLLQENDEIWNNANYRFTFYSPATGTVRSTDVQTLCTDSAGGLDALMRQALDGSADARSADSLHASLPPADARPAMPQLSVTSVDSVPDAERDAATQAPDTVAQAPDAAALAPDNVFLHPNYARGPREPQDQRAPQGSQERSRSAGRPGGAAHSRDAQNAERGLRTDMSRLFWLDVMDPTNDEIIALSRVFDLHPLTTDELLLLKSQSSVQDSFKSFRHYDIVCYRTSSVTAVPAAQGPAPSAMRGFTDSADSLYGRDPAEKDRPLIQDLARRARPGWGQATSSGREAPHKRALRHRLASLFSRPPAEEREPADGDTPLSSSPPPHAPHRVADLTDVSGSPLVDADDVLDEPVAFYMIMMATGIVTVHFCNVPHVRNTIARLNLDEEQVRLSPDYIAYLLLDDITDTLVPTTRLLELEVDAIDELVLILTRAEHDDVLKRIGIERRHALWLVRLLHGKAEVLRAVERRIQAKAAGDGDGGTRYMATGSPAIVVTAGAPGCDDRDNDGRDNDCSASDEDAMASQLLTSDEEEGGLYRSSRGGVRGEAQRRKSAMAAAAAAAHPDVIKYLADVHDHLTSLTASVHHCERILARAHGNYLARINLELTHASNTTNQLATQMTILAGIFLPLNLVAGIFGMNVKVPGRDRDDLRDFALIVGSMGLFVVFTLAFCRWRRII
ncbi:CorA metal ion transporter [Coemansia biformis]|uniref:CorA metal ion transporter n=1 Tax=Coemansia biformis TaxID=1286918 RepID=A0A9W7Y977_9FUNG|nr:CorA metal ion transporter [Coemansia biformis]